MKNGQQQQRGQLPKNKVYLQGHAFSHVVGGLLDEGIDMENLLVYGFLKWAHLHPLHKLEIKPSSTCKNYSIKNDVFF